MGDHRVGRFDQHFCDVGRGQQVELLVDLGYLVEEEIGKVCCKLTC